ncbi:rho GTPase-activating protein 20 [Kryptolebias marmoratus]|uniref:rho GTPase-activating protein 20 n=1 Tax=Kryptolebias marmoratus TaxID=37003 RepID=UPI0018ACF9AF|nr:rho GTPase-activating protein 20 [Kryptolebias marmoratus]
MDTMSPQQQQESLDRGGQQEHKRRMKFQSYRRQSAPSSVITKALTRSKTLSRDSFVVPVCPETCSLVQSRLTVPGRSFLLYGHVQLKTGMQTQDRHLFLFTDVLLVAKAKSANHFKQKLQVSVREMWTAGCTDEVCEGSTNPERSFVMGWPTWNCVAMFSSAEQRDRWLSCLKSRIKDEKEAEEPKTIPLRVYGKGINSFAVIKTLPVSNSDSTNEVIRLALQQFDIIGNVKDFQLWVISKRDNTPYPLIGHEFPFSIQMSHARSPARRDAASPPAERGECQFVLRPRPAEPPRQHAPAEMKKKNFPIFFPPEIEHNSIVGYIFFFRMICRLAKENALLLRYLLALLHGVQSNAHENQMTSFNLSVCIAPSLLWPPGLLGSPEVEGRGTKKVCELVRFMIDRCPQILGEEPAALFGGPPRRLGGDEAGSESWVYPLTDSSYDSLENELDNISGGSPGFCGRRPLHLEALQSSLDSILTFSDYDQDADPEALRAKAGVRIHLAERRRRPEARAGDTSPTLDSLSLEGGHAQQQRRRCSEPAIAYAARFCPYISGSADDLAARSPAPARTHGEPAALGASASSLSSTSPAPTRSSLDSLDSLGAERTGAANTEPAFVTIPPPSPFASGSSRTPGEPSNRPKDAKDPHHWGALKGCMSLHPNSWLKKDRRLSLTQQEGLNVEDNDKMATGSSDKSHTAGKVEKGASKTKPRPPRRGSKDAERVTSRHPEPESSLDVATTTGQAQPSPSSFHTHGGPSLSLFKRRKAESAEGSGERLPSDPGLEASDPPEPRFGLSPCASKVVRDYFSPQDNPQSSQKVALAVAEGRREWLKRCSDPNVEPDLEQLLFAEESYV